jgi:hypothetical protein
MKALADIKRRQISTSVVETLPDEHFNYQPRSFGRPSRHGLHAVSPLNPKEVEERELAREAPEAKMMVSNAAKLVIRQAFTNKATPERMTTPKLTTEEFIEVRLATVRESTRHCYWPSDVVARFAAADVIR